VNRMINEFMEHLPRKQRQFIAVLTDCLVLPFALWSALALRLGQLNPPVLDFWPAFAVASLISIPVFGALGLYRHVARHVGTHAMLAVIKGATITAIAVAAVAYMVPLKGFPRSVPIIFWAFTLVYVSGTRFFVRDYIRRLQDRFSEREFVVIYGAGRRGAELAQVLMQQGRYVPVGFVDDDKRLQRRIVDGLMVYAPRHLGRLIKSSGATQVFVAVTSDAAEDRRAIIQYLEPFGVRVRLIPDLIELASGRQSIANIRDVEIEDLLGRETVDPLPHLLQGSVRGRSVMVTGAGGSIGSELCRQIIRQHPRLLVALDVSEYALFEIQRELLRLGAAEDLQTPVVAVSSGAPTVQP